MLNAELPDEFRLGTITSGQRAGQFFTIRDSELDEHGLILGRTGMGKSRFINQLAREHLMRRRALILIDPDGDLSEDILGYVTRLVVETGMKRILQRVHYVEPSPLLSFGYDPFAFVLPMPVDPTLLVGVREAWMHCKMDRVSDILLRSKGQQSFDGMPRLQRVLRDVLYVVAKEVEGRRMSLADASFVLNFGEPLNDRLWQKVAGRLPPDIAADFRLMRAMRSLEALRRETESTLNRLRSYGPVVRSIFTQTAPGRALDLYHIIQNGNILLVNLRPSHFLSPDQARALGQLFIYDAFATAMITPRQLRQPCTLVVDEAAEFVTEDIGAIMRRGRKYRFAVVLASQMLSSFRRGDVDLTDVVISQPRTLVSFNQRLPKDLELLSHVLFQKQLDFTPLVQEVERDGGTVFVPVIEGSVGVNHGRNWNTTDGQSSMQGTSLARGMSIADALGWSKTEGQQQMRGTATTSGDSESDGTSEGTQQSPLVNRGEVEAMLPLLSAQSSRQRMRSSTVATNRQESSSTNTGVTATKTKTENIQLGANQQEGRSHSTADGGSEGDSLNLSLRFAQIHQTIRELQNTGQLETGLNEQLAKFAQVLASLERRQAVVLAGTDSFVIESIDVPDPFRSPEALMRSIEWVKSELAQVHPYLFVPNLDPAEEERRIRAFLDGPAAMIDDVAPDAIVEAREEGDADDLA